MSELATEATSASATRPRRAAVVRPDEIVPDHFAHAVLLATNREFLRRIFHGFSATGGRSFAAGTGRGRGGIGRFRRGAFPTWRLCVGPADGRRAPPARFGRARLLSTSPLGSWTAPATRFAPAGPTVASSPTSHFLGPAPFLPRSSLCFPGFSQARGTSAPEQFPPLKTLIPRSDREGSEISGKR